MTESRLSSYSPAALGVLRIMSGLLCLEHGTQKFFSFPDGKMSGVGWGFDNPIAFAGIFELFCGLLIALGLFTRPAAFLASGTMAVAYFMVHAPQNFWPLNNGGETPVLYCFVFLYLVFAGPGAFSVDPRIGRNSPKS